MTLQNGVENEARLSEIFGRERVLGGNARVGVEIVEPAKLVHLSSGHIDFGELDSRESDRAQAIAEIFRRAGIMGELSHNIMLLRWDKLVWNGAFNTVTTLTRRRVGALLDDPEGLRLVCKLMREIIDAARAEDYEIGYECIDTYLGHSRKNLRELKTSTQQELERASGSNTKRWPARWYAARRHHLQVPAMEAVYALLRLLNGTRTA